MYHNLTRNSELLREGRKWCSGCEKSHKLAEFRIQKNGKPAVYCIAHERKRHKARYQANGTSEERRARLQENNWFRKYGITEQQYNAMYEAQEGLCDACGWPETEIDPRSNKVRMLAVDHCHKTGKVRALLCGPCNRSLGYFNEDPKRIAGLLRYAEKIQAT